MERISDLARWFFGAGTTTPKDTCGLTCDDLQHPARPHVALSFDGLEAVLEAVAGTVDGDDPAVVQEAAEDGGGQDLIAEHLSHSLKVLFEVKMIEPFS